MRYLKSTFAVAAVALASTAWSQEKAAPANPPVLRAGPDTHQNEKQDAKKVYDEKADAKQQIAAALAKAQKENRRVLIQWGGNWCSWCVKLHELFKSNKEIARTLMYEYDVVYVDAGKPTGKNIDLGSSYGADLSKGFPYLTILSAEGKPLANQETGSLEVDGKSVAAGHDPKKVLEFLKTHQAPYRNADDVLKDGLESAKKSGKAAFVHFGAPWCGWCHKLEAWLERPDVHKALSADFVVVKIDIDRMEGGKRVMERFAGAAPTGIPWFAMLDADGQVLADSFAKPGDAKSNIGFPAAAEEIAHFEAMLKKAAKSLSAEGVKALTKTLMPEK